MTTPIFDFVRSYAERGKHRFHMPGHKGVGLIGCEAYDITEISGADVLYSADGIIHESENNLTAIYGTSHSFYSTEGSTLAIKAMLYLACRGTGESCPLVLAARNVHTAFVKAAALIDIDVSWIYPEDLGHLCECRIDSFDVERAILSAERKPSAVYVTSPDYLGNLLDIRGIASVCRKYDVPLLVDNAHGAYLKLLREDMHPMTLGAAMCADSAHKTLPVLTGGAYLHVSKDYPQFAGEARMALSLFASTSPSYLILSSLDVCNKLICDGYRGKIADLVNKTLQIKEKIREIGFVVRESEPLKIVIEAGCELARYLHDNGCEVEFSDNDFTVLMLTPENTDEDLSLLLDLLSSFEGKRGCGEIMSVSPHERAVSIREAVFAESETVSAQDAVGRVCASPTVSCPPAVPILISGEIITSDDVKLFIHYGVDKISVIKNKSKE